MQASIFNPIILSSYFYSDFLATAVTFFFFVCFFTINLTGYFWSDVVSWCRQAPENVNILAFGYSSFLFCSFVQYGVLYMVFGRKDEGRTCPFSGTEVHRWPGHLHTGFVSLQHKCTFLTLSLLHTLMNAHTSSLFIRVKTGALSFIISVTVAIATLSTASASSPRAASGPHLWEKLQGTFHFDSSFWRIDTGVILNEIWRKLCFCRNEKEQNVSQERNTSLHFD